jgi:DNA-directed RNA polymerase subunit beta'
MPVRANLMVGDGDEVQPGDVIAKIPRETTKTKDITGGLPRVVELFEARKPRLPAIMSEIDGIVELGSIVKGKRKIVVTGDDGEQREYDIPRGTHINVQEGDRVRAGEALMDGPLNPHDILRVLGYEQTARISRERNSRGLSLAGREHQRQAHRGDRPSDVALGEDSRSRRHGLPARRTG